MPQKFEHAKILMSQKVQAVTKILMSQKFQPEVCIYALSYSTSFIFSLKNSCWVVDFLDLKLETEWLRKVEILKRYLLNISDEIVL